MSISNFLRDKVRLVVEYILIAIIIVCAGTAATLWMKTKNLELSNQRLDSRVVAVEAENKVQADTISELTALRERDAQVTEGLALAMSKIAIKDSSIRTKLQSVEVGDEKVRNFLDDPIPSNIICLLDDTCGEGGHKDPDNKAAKSDLAPVRGPTRP